MSQKVGRLQRKLSQSLTKSKNLVDETMNQQNQVTLCQTAATASVLESQPKTGVRRPSRKHQQEQQLKL